MLYTNYGIYAGGEQEVGGKQDEGQILDRGH